MIKLGHMLSRAWDYIN